MQRGSGLKNGRVEAELTRIGRQRNQSWARREWIDELRQDLRFAWRQCRTKPGFTVAAVLTLALGIGATTAIFSVVHAVVLKPYAYVDPDRVLLAFSMFRGNRGSWSVGNFDYFRQRLTSVEDFAADVGTSMNLADNGEPERIFGGRVTWNYFRLFGIQPAHGRTFTRRRGSTGTQHGGDPEPPLVAASVRTPIRPSSADRSASTTSRTMSSASCRRKSSRSATKRKRGCRSRSRRSSWRCTTSSI